MCDLNTTAMFHQTYVTDAIEEVQLAPPPKSLGSLQCPLPGLEVAYHALVTSILYNIMYPSVRLYKGILLTGDHGLGKTSIVLPLFPLHSRSTAPSPSASPTSTYSHNNSLCSP